MLIASRCLPGHADKVPLAAVTLLDLHGTLNVLAAHLATLRLAEQGRRTVAIIVSWQATASRTVKLSMSRPKPWSPRGVAAKRVPARRDVILVKPGRQDCVTDHLLGASPVAKPRRCSRHRPLSSLGRRSLTPLQRAVIMQIIRMLPGTASLNERNSRNE